MYHPRSTYKNRPDFPFKHFINLYLLLGVMHTKHEMKEENIKRIVTLTAIIPLARMYDAVDVLISLIKT